MNKPELPAGVAICRAVSLQMAHVRAVSEGEDTYVEFTPIITGVESVYMGYVEILAAKCLDETDFSDVRAVINHDPNLLFGRTKSGTLTFEIKDTDGGNKKVVARAKLPKSAPFDYYRELIERGDLAGCSFRAYWSWDDYEWERRPDGVYIGTVQKISRVDDFSIVTYPAYPDTEESVGLRSLEAFKRANNQQERKLTSLEKKEKRFLTDMIPHHEMAVEMAGKVLSSERLKDFAQGIIDAQTAEIDQMKEWLSEWFGDDADASDGEMDMKKSRSQTIARLAGTDAQITDDGMVVRSAPEFDGLTLTPEEVETVRAIRASQASPPPTPEYSAADRLLMLEIGL